MKIAILAWEALEGIAIGGGAIYTSRLAAALARAGHQIRLFTRLGPNQPMEDIQNNIHIRRCPWDRRPTFLDEIDALSHAFTHYLADSLKSEGHYDLIHCHEWFTIAAGLKAVALTPAKLAVGFHSTEWGRTGKWPDSGDSARIAQIEHDGIRRADAIIAASHWVRRTIHEQFHPPDWKCEVVYHGCDPLPVTAAAGGIAGIRQAAGLKDGQPSLLYAGRFTPAGGADLVAGALREVARERPDAKFLFVGEGKLDEELRRAVGAAGLFVPLRGRVVAPELYQAVDLVLAPFRRDHNGRAVLPAWAAGKPVATLRNTVPSEFILPGVNGWTVGEDPLELAAVIVKAFGNLEHTAWMGSNGRAAAETAFSWDESAKRLLAAFVRGEELTPRAVMA